MKKDQYRGAAVLRYKFLEQIQEWNAERSQGTVTRDVYMKRLASLRDSCKELNMMDVAQEIHNMMGSP